MTTHINHQIAILIKELWRTAESAFNNSNEQIWQSYGAVLFTLVFFSVGIYRVVEFFELGLKPRLSQTLIALHILGLTLFSIAAFVFGIDSASRHTQFVGVVLGTSLVVLFPVHIYINLLRRVRLRKQLNR